MNTTLWLATGVLAIGFLGGGAAMLAVPKDRLREVSGTLHYLDDFDAPFIKLLGMLKLLAVAGLLLPPWLDTAPGLVPLAALGIVLVMAGASTVRIMRREWQFLLGDLALFVIAAFVAWGRFDLSPL